VLGSLIFRIGSSHFAANCIHDDVPDESLYIRCRCQERMCRRKSVFLSNAVPFCFGSFLPCLALLCLLRLCPQNDLSCLSRRLLSICTYLIPRTRVVDVNGIRFTASSICCVLEPVIGSRQICSPMCMSISVVSSRNLSCAYSTPAPQQYMQTTPFIQHRITLHCEKKIPSTQHEQTMRACANARKARCESITCTYNHTSE
jgi:hypothetical protein